MATVTRYTQGTGTGKAVGESGLKVYQAVVDIEQLYDDGYASTDTFKIFTIPANTLIMAVDAQITETLANVTSVSIGYTASGTEYVSAETDTAVGRFTDYENSTPACLDEGANYQPRLATSAEGVYLTLGALGATSDGKVSITVAVVDLVAKAPARPHVYTNV